MESSALVVILPQDFHEDTAFFIINQPNKVIMRKSPTFFLNDHILIIIEPLPHYTRIALCQRRKTIELA